MFTDQSLMWHSRRSSEGAHAPAHQVAQPPVKLEEASQLHEVDYLTSEHLSPRPGLKLSILDVKCTDSWVSLMLDSRASRKVIA